MSNNYHLYQKQRSLNYNYIDRVVKSYIEQGGAIFHIYPLIATIDTNGNEHLIEQGSVGDSVLNENPKRKYSKETYDLWGVTMMNTPTFSFNFDGLSLLDGDEKEISFHYNSMVAQLGRKIVIGDVIEWSWLRDLDILGSETAANKFYQVTSSERDEKGWAANYKYHLWKIKCKPITNSPEFSDLFNNGEENTFYEDVNSENGGGGMDPNNTTNDNELKNNDDVLEEAEINGPSYRLHDEHHIYLDKNDKIYDEYGRFIPQGIDGIPNDLNCDNIKYGEFFPDSSEVKNGDYFLRSDYNPPRLYQRIINENTNQGHWKLVEYDNREEWTGVPAIIRRAINMNEKIILNDGSELSRQQNIKDLVPARVKKEHKNKRPWNKITLIQPDKTPTGI